MQKIIDEKELLGILEKDIEQSDKEIVYFFAGHFPLVYKEEGAIEALDIWGVFSMYTLELACKVAQKFKDKKDIRFVFFVDDLTYEDRTKMGWEPLRTQRRNLYKKRSGEGAVLNTRYHEILKKYGFDESYVLRQDHKKEGRHDCLYFSEKILRASEKKINNPCAREYTEFIEDTTYFDKSITYMVSFIPRRCEGHICNIALDNEIKRLSSSHIFLETMMPTLSREELYTIGRGVFYRKD